MTPLLVLSTKALSQKRNPNFDSQLAPNLLSDSFQSPSFYLRLSAGHCTSLQHCVHLHVPGHSGIRRTARSLKALPSRKKGVKKKEKRPTEASISKAGVYQLRTADLKHSSTSHPFHNRSSWVQESSQDTLFSLSCPSLIVHHWQGVLIFVEFVIWA